VAMLFSKMSNFRCEMPIDRGINKTFARAQHTADSPRYLPMIVPWSPLAMRWR
jgi:hypothetical protein